LGLALLVRLGIIARSDNTGLGNQTRELVNMLKPSKVMLIDSSPFNNNEQNPEWFSEYNCVKTNGFATDKEVLSFLGGLDVVLSCEIFYNPSFVSIAKNLGIKTILQYNYEFLEYLNTPGLKLPDVLVAPSQWNIDKVIDRFSAKTKVIHLPPPTDSKIFSNAKEINMSKSHKRILHIAGKKAAKDRNGTNSVIEMLKYSKEDYELVIRSQTKIETHTRDHRLTIENGNPKNREDMYVGFDAMVLPRRYAGLCLPMNEALLSGLPVFMTDISPNNLILDKDWLVPSSSIGTFKTKAMIELFEVNPKKLGQKIDSYIVSNQENDKQKAFDIGFSNFAPENLLEKYLDIISHA
jgi:glycosyltransferase involved in cell wall biosynthesis